MRSMMFTPAVRPERAEKGWSAKPDAIILDLEDAVAAERKVEARGLAAGVIAKMERPWWVRINALDTPFWEDDVRAVVQRNLAGIMVPKARSAAEILAVERVLDECEETHGIASPIALGPIVENVVGLAHVRDIAGASRRVSFLTFGEGDFTLDLGIDWDSSSPTLIAAKAQLVLESRLAGLDRPHDGVYPHLGDPAALERSCLAGKALGFGAKHCIHPEQIATIHAVFTPSAKALERAQRIVDGFEAALATGSASTTIDGEFIDYPVYHRAQNILGEV